MSNTVALTRKQPPFYFEYNDFMQSSSDCLTSKQNAAYQGHVSLASAVTYIVSASIMHWSRGILHIISQW